MGVGSVKRQTWETCLRAKERSSCRLERPKNRTEAGVRASVVAQASREAARTSRTDRRRVTIAGAKGRRKMDREGNKMSEETLSAVTSEKEPKQDKETLRARWAWVEHGVWTDSMLRTLEKGIKGGKWFALIDKVYEPKNLQSGFWKVWRNAGSAGIDGQSVKSFEAREEQQLQELAEELRTGRYRPAAVKRVWIPKPGSQEKRPLGIPVVRDRVVQAALRNVIEPIFERDFAVQSYGFRPGRGAREALRRVEELLKEGNYWVVDADIKGYFDSIPHSKLMETIGRKISDGRVLKLIESYLKAGVMETGKGWEATPEGTPQGGVMTPRTQKITCARLALLAAA